MAARRFLQNIDIHKVNLVLYGFIIILVVAFHQELLWAAKEIPMYIAGVIDAPLEVYLYKSASKIIQEEKDISRALPLLNRAIKIDPNSEAVFWLGEYYFKKGEAEKALIQYRLHKELDPSCITDYLRCARIYESGRDYKNARSILQSGMDYFRRSIRYEPRIDSTISDNFNIKTEEIFRQNHKSLIILQNELMRIRQK